MEGLQTNELTYSAQSIWNKVVEKMISEIAAISLDTWIKPLIPLKIEDNKLFVLAPHANGRKMVETRFKTTLNNVLLRVNPNFNEVVILDNADDNSIGGTDTAALVNPINQNILETTIFRPEYTFDNFVVGKSNQLAQTVAQSVADKPSEIYNPLVIYGKTGLGKTHLLHAIGNYIVKHHSGKRILYTTCEAFMNEMLYAISAGRQASQDFRDKYRINVDILLMDDIQFIAGKERTQEEFFNTFEALHNANKQIILVSDRPVKDINPLEDRLRSRLNWDMSVDILPPDIETRMAILQKKAANKKVNLKPDVIINIAQIVTSNIRELEGFLSKVIAYSQLMNRPLTVDIVDEVKKDYMQEPVENVSMDMIIDTVCSYYNVTRTDMMGRKKNKEIIEPRMMCIYIITEMLDSVPLTKIGQVFGGRDHTTIIHARDKISELSSQAKYRVIIQDIRSMLIR